MNSFRKTLLILFSVIFLFSYGLETYAAFDPPFATPENLISPDKVKTEGEKITGSDDKGAVAIAGILMSIVDLIRTVLGTGVILFMVYAGVMMVTAGGNEDQVNKANTQLVWAGIALGLILLSKPMILNVFYGGSEKLAPAEALKNDDTIRDTIKTGTGQILAMLDWGQVLLVSIAFAYLVFSGWRMILALGNQEEISKQKQVILWMGIGFFVIALNKVIIQDVIYGRILNQDYTVSFQQNPSKGISEFIGLLSYILKFAGIIAFATLIIGGFMYIYSFMDEEKAELAKKIILDAIIGLVIILVSYAMVGTLVTGTPQTDLGDLAMNFKTFFVAIS